MNYTEIVSNISKKHKQEFNLFLLSIKKRIGFENKIRVDEVISSFNKMSLFISKDNILQFHYNINRLNLVKCLVYDGEFLYVENNGESIKSYKEAILDWYELELDKGRKMMLGKIANSIG